MKLRHDNRYRDLSGHKFGRLTVLQRVPDKKPVTFTCSCECGNTTVVMSGNLVNGTTKSCGCLRNEDNARKFKTHGMRGSKIYRTWGGMKSRCFNPKSSSYYSYGARGIIVCDRWMKFENFYADMGDVPEGLSLDRIDPNGNYEPLNCKWSTKKEQSINKRKVMMFNQDRLLQMIKIHIPFDDNARKILEDNLWRLYVI